MSYKNLQKRRDCQKNWRERNKDRIKSWRERNKEYLNQQHREWRNKNRKYYNQRASLLHRLKTRAKRKELAELLGNQCEQCGFDDRRAFQFHHRDGNGIDHRKSQGMGAGYYQRLIVEARKNLAASSCCAPTATRSSIGQTTAPMSQEKEKEDSPKRKCEASDNVTAKANR